LQIPVQLTTPTRCKTYCADEAENAAAVACVRKQYPTLKIVGRCHGYLRGEALRAKVAEINALAPDDPRLYSCHRPRGGPRTALKLLLEGHSGGAFNLGTGNGFSVREILAAIAAETGREVPHVVKPRRSGDPTYLVADPSVARATLNFRPTHSDLATIIRTAWAWHKKAHPLKTGAPVRE
jgi:hypothetical protein